MYILGFLIYLIFFVSTISLYGYERKIQLIYIFYPGVYRVSFIINEPYREEFDQRGEKFQKFAENLTKSIEDVLHTNLRKEHHVTFVKME